MMFLMPAATSRAMRSCLNTIFRTPTPPQTLLAETSWTTETPHNTAELEKQTELIKRHLTSYAEASLSPTVQALNQLVKGCEMAIQSSTVLADRIIQLEAEN